MIFFANCELKITSTTREMKPNCSLSLVCCGSFAVFMSGLIFFVFLRIELQINKRDHQQKALVERLSAIEKRLSHVMTESSLG